jgi:dipeptidase E
MARNMLLVSNSVNFGSGYLDHCEEQIRELFAGVREVLFVPYAGTDPDAYSKRVRDRFERLGIEVESLHEAGNPKKAVREAQAIFVGGGNTFLLLNELQRKGVLPELRQSIRRGIPYLGSSAGVNIASPTISTTNDMPIVPVRTLDALGVIPFQINPHYIEPEPNSRHQGETREQRIKQYHDLNPTPVLGLREGAMLRIRGNQMQLIGNGAKLFRPKRRPREFKPQAMHFLLRP